MIEDLPELLEAIDIEWVLDREGVGYKESYGRSGRQLNVRECPCCGSSGYKVYINAENGLGNCFAGDCDMPTFNKYRYLSKLFNTSGRKFVELLKDLAREQGWRPKRKTVAVVHAPGTLNLPASLPIADMTEAPEYLRRRGLSKETAAYFHLRWSESGKFEVALPSGRTAVQDYSRRIIIPVMDLDRELVTFQGRDATGTAAKRYLFPPTFAASGAYLYNGFNWQAGMDTAVVCEGVFDVVGVKQAIDGVANLRDYLPVGTFGMHLSTNSPEGNDQLGRLRKLKAKGLKRVIFLWDGEFKAVKAAAEASIHLRGMGLEPWIAVLPVGLDPGEATTAQIQRALLAPMRASSKLDLLKVLQFAKQTLGNT